MARLGETTGLSPDSNTPRTVEIAVEHWPIRGSFTISRGSKTEAAVVVATIRQGDHQGRGECVPYARYGESIEGTVDAIKLCLRGIAMGMGRGELAAALPPGAARNALDCALWELEAKLAGTSPAELAGVGPLRPTETALTISLGTAEAMAEQATRTRDYPLLKLKLGGDGDEERLKAVRDAVPAARLIADANEAWRSHDLEPLLGVAADCGVELIEQPLPADGDDVLASIGHPVPICADESAHDRASLGRIADRYDAVNIKLDKAGGLTEALAMAYEARERGLKIMVGSMVATSLAMAPALLLAQKADFVDLDGPLLLEKDRTPGLRYEGGSILPPPPGLWG